MVIHHKGLHETGNVATFHEPFHYISAKTTGPQSMFIAASKSEMQPQKIALLYLGNSMKLSCDDLRWMTSQFHMDDFNHSCYKEGSKSFIPKNRWSLDVICKFKPLKTKICSPLLQIFDPVRHLQTNSDPKNRLYPNQVNAPITWGTYVPIISQTPAKKKDIN